MTTPPLALPAAVLDAAVEALTEVMTDADCASKEYPFSDESRARAILESDWLAAREKTLIEAAEARGAVRALEDAADVWQQGEWTGAPRRADRAAQRIANAQHVTDWLRNRAATYRKADR